MNSEEWEYTQARDYARETLLFAWKRFESKTDDMIALLNSLPLSTTYLQGNNQTTVNLSNVTSKLQIVKSNLSIKISEIRNLDFGNNDSNESYTADVTDKIKNYVGMGKTLGINWFQAFVTNQGYSTRRLQDLMFLWKNFCSQNLWIRYSINDPIFRTAKQTSNAALRAWVNANNIHLLSCFHEAILTINLMRNISQHWEDSYYAQDALQTINKNLNDPLTNLQGVPINYYTLFISLANEITGLLRSLEIFHESIQIASKGGLTQSEKQRRLFQITCSNCNNTDQVPFRPPSGTPVLCHACFWAQEEQLLR